MLAKYGYRLTSGVAALTKRRVAAMIFICATVLFPIILYPHNYSARQVLLAMILLDVCLYPTYRYFAREETGLPVLPVLCLSFALQYAIPIFTQEPGILLFVGFRYLDEASIEAALVLTILGVVLLQTTYYFIAKKGALKAIPSVSLPLNRKRTEIYCVAIFLASIFLPRLQTVLSEDNYLQFQAIIFLFQNQVLVVIGVLAWIVYTGQGARWQKILLYIIVAVAALRGFSTTMMEQMILPLAVFFMTRWLYLRRLPVMTFALIAFLFVFLSPVKRNIRGTMIASGESAFEVSATARATDWIEQATDYWRDTFSGTRNLTESTSDAASRADQIHNFAHIYSLTPSVLPYQNGNTYSYLAIAWIPRLIWPQKPQANAANNYYAVAYEISTEEGIQHSSFGVSLIGEGYINFGAAGVFLAMIVLGGVLATLQHVFAGPTSGPGGHAIFLATFVYFLNGIGTSTELMFGGLIQNLACASILLWMVRESVPTKKPRVELPVLLPTKPN
ncbi:MAG: hypothetical protein ACREBG_07255 [Pyrinomonadaceae bacterium]